jgi:PAS domain S-box-containing protein
VSAVHRTSRLDALRRTGLLDSPPEEDFDRLTRLASAFLRAPIALLSLVDEDRQFFKSCVGMPDTVAAARSTPLEYSFCRFAIESDEPLLIADARQHPLLRDNPAIREFGVIAYAGVPLVMEDGEALGTLCVFDRVPRQWTAHEVSTLHDLAVAAVTGIALRRERAERMRSQVECEALRRALAAERQRIDTLSGQEPLPSALRDSEAHHRRVLDSLPVIVYRSESSPPYETIYVNRAVESLGFTREEWLARPDMWESRLHPDDRARVRRETRASLEGAGSMESCYRLLAKDGSVRWFHDRGEFVPDEQGERVVWQGIMFDITALREAEDALRESEARHRLVFDEAGVGMAVCDLDGRIEQANAALCEFFGYPAWELEGRKYQEVLHPDDHAMDREKSDALEAGTIPSFTLERRYFKKDGTMVWGLLTAALLRGADGTPTRRIAQVQDITERKRAESALQQSEARIRALAETAHEGIWAVDQVGVTTYVNARLCEMLGYAVEEVVGRTLFDFMPRSTAFEARTLFARRQRGIAEVHEFAFARRDGSELYALMSMSPLFAPDGEFVGALAMVTDITARRQAEEALRASEARYRQVVANAPGMVYQFVYRPDGTKGYTFVSEGARELFGVEPDAALRDPEALLGLVHPDEIDEMRQRARAVAEVAGDFRWEGRVILASGEERFIQVVAHDQRAPDGTLVSDGLVVDVTDRRRAAQRLDESEARFRLVARATNDVVYDWNIPAGEHFWAETLLTAFGHDQRLFRPTYEWWRSLIHPDDVERVHGSLMAVLGGASEAWTEEYRFRRSDGTYARVLDRSFVLRDAAGDAVRLVGSMTDLTEHQFLEEQLRQSQKMEAVGRLAGGVAHDFNNLITIIKASTSFLLADMDAADTRCEDVRQIAAAADRAAGLTRQLLAFSRRQILNPTPVRVNSVVENLRPMLARLIGEHIVVETKLGEGIGSIMADVGQLEQVLINLAVTARDAMPDGGRILIETAQVTLDGRHAANHVAQERTVVLPGRYVMLAVGDTGTGMSRDVQARIFEPFYTTKDAGKGTGLGLSTVYGIVKQSGGHVWVYSEPGHGTVFKLYFPQVSGAMATPLGQGVVADSAGGSETILLVEDEDALRGLARRILGRQGYHVLESRNGREALERAAQYDGPIHLVLTDVIMPEMSGRGLVERLRAVRPRAAILYMSGYTDDDVVRRGLFEPGSRFVQKPFVPDELLRIVRSALDARNDATADTGVLPARHD